MRRGNGVAVDTGKRQPVFRHVQQFIQPVTQAPSLVALGLQQRKIGGLRLLHRRGPAAQRGPLRNPVNEPE